MTSFPCEKCGKCCKLVSCEYLNDTLCTIYENRPDVCSVDRMAKIRGMDKETAYRLNKEACKWIQEGAWNR